MKRVHAILHEPASYTVDRNQAVYDKLGITYSYLHTSSEAKSESLAAVQGVAGLSLHPLLKFIRKILSENDIVIMNGYTGRVFFWLFMINLFYKRPIGIDSDTPLNIPDGKLKRFIKSLYLNTIFRVSWMYGLPGGTKSHRELFLYYGMKPDRIFLMPMMVNNQKFISAPHQTTGKIRFLYVGRIIDVKNLPVMIEAYSSMFGNSNNVELRIVGSGNRLEEYKAKYSHLQNICFSGPKYGQELIEEYRNADVFILPSSFEPWGLVINEALSAGLPVIVSDRVGASYDLVEKPQTGFVFKYNDPNDLAIKMQTIVNDKKLYQHFADNAKAYMTEHWNYNFYRECLIKFIENAK